MKLIKKTPFLVFIAFALSSNGTSFGYREGYYFMSRPKGYRVTEETKEKIRQKAKLRTGEKSNRWGKKLTDIHKKKLGDSARIANRGKHPKHSQWMLENSPRRGVKLSVETKEKQRNAALNRKNKFGWVIHPDTVKKSIIARKKKIAETGTCHSIETRKKLSEIQKQKVKEGNHHLWKGGISDENKKARETIEYKLWRESVFKRDNYTCVKCGKRGNGTLNADHILPFAYFPELRTEISNGQTLCLKCHRKTKTYGKGSKTMYGNTLFS